MGMPNLFSNSIYTRIFFTENEAGILIKYYTDKNDIQKPYVRNNAIFDLLYKYELTEKQFESLVTAITSFHQNLETNHLTKNEKCGHLKKLCDGYFICENKENSRCKLAMERSIKNWISLNRPILDYAIPEIYSDSEIVTKIPSLS